MGAPSSYLRFYAGEMARREGNGIQFERCTPDALTPKSRNWCGYRQRRMT